MAGWLWPNGSITRPRLSGEGTPAQSEADFGPRTIGKGFHDGTDFAFYFTNVCAISGGVVSRVEVWNGKTSMQHGNRVHVDHGGGVVSSYSHLAGINVHKGQRVSAGDVLGPMGYTGFVTGAHLHLEVRVNGVLVDPVPFIAARLGATAGDGGTEFDPMPTAKEVVDELLSRQITKIGGETMSVADAWTYAEAGHRDTQVKAEAIRDQLARNLPIYVWAHEFDRPDLVDEGGVPVRQSAGEILRHEPADHATTRAALARVGAVDAAPVVQAVRDAVALALKDLPGVDMARVAEAAEAGARAAISGLTLRAV